MCSRRSFICAALACGACLHTFSGVASASQVRATAYAVTTTGPYDFRDVINPAPDASTGIVMSSGNRGERAAGFADTFGSLGFLDTDTHARVVPVYGGARTAANALYDDDFKIVCNRDPVGTRVVLHVVVALARTSGATLADHFFSVNNDATIVDSAFFAVSGAGGVARTNGLFEFQTLAYNPDFELHRGPLELNGTDTLTLNLHVGDLVHLSAELDGSSGVSLASLQPDALSDAYLRAVMQFGADVSDGSGDH